MNSYYYDLVYLYALAYNINLLTVNKSKIGKILGLSRQTVSTRIKKMQNEGLLNTEGCVKIFNSDIDLSVLRTFFENGENIQIMLLYIYIVYNPEIEIITARNMKDFFHHKILAEMNWSEYVKILREKYGYEIGAWQEKIKERDACNTGVYGIFSQGELVYIGKTNIDFKARWRGRYNKEIENLKDKEFKVLYRCNNTKACNEMEKKLIKTFKPKYNYVNNEDRSV